MENIVIILEGEIKITKRIFDLCDEKKININKLATLSGLQAGTIRGITYGKSKNVGTRTLLDICEALDITIFDFFNDEIFKSRDIEGSY